MNFDSAKVRALRVLSVREHAPQLKSVFVERTFDAEPGQFVNVWIPGVDEKPFSIAGLGESGLELAVRGMGAFSQRMCALQPGDRVGIRGPFGRGFTLEDDGVLVAGGTGLAPVRFLWRRLEERGLRSRVAVGVRTRSDLLFAEEFPPEAVTSEDGTLGTRGLVTVRVEALLAERRPGVIYGAGPEPMLLALRALADRHGLPYQLSFERYMKCGFGLCGQCCFDGSGQRVCTEGPVFRRGELEGVTDLGKPHRSASGRRPQ